MATFDAPSAALHNQAITWPALRRLAPLAVAFAAVLVIAGPARAAAPRPHLAVHEVALPSHFSESDNTRCLEEINEPRVRACDGYQITVTDTGALKTDGSTITIKAVLPPTLEAEGVALFRLVPQGLTEPRGATACTLATLSCRYREETIGGTSKTGTLKPDESVEMQLYVTVKGGTGGSLSSSVNVSGGGASEASTSAIGQISEEPSPFGASLGAEMNAPDGAIETQAGGHPYEFRTRFDLSTVMRTSPESQLIPTSSEDLKDAIVELPMGFGGSVARVPTCTFVQLASIAGCPADSRVGELYTEPESIASTNSAIYNMLPERGVAAEFGFTDVLNNTHAIYAQVVPTPEGYVLRASTRDIPQIALTDAVITFFGTPAVRDGSSGAATAMFTTPADCSGTPLVTTAYLDSWQQPGRLLTDGNPDLTDPAWKVTATESPAVTGCSALEGRFEPSISATPSSSQADSPTGLNLDITVPQHESPEELGTPPLRDALITLPAGMTVNPSSANGLEACSLAQVGFSADGEPNAVAPTCPNASKIGTVELETPALPSEVCKEATKNLTECPSENEREKTPLQGSIYLARQDENPFGSLLAIYIVINDSRTGVLVKLAGEVKADDTTGQLTTVVHDSPQFPFTELRTHFFAGAAAPLATPAVCGLYTVGSQLTPWSAPESGPPASPQASFTIGESSSGDACGAAFSPTFTSATESATAGAYSPLQITFARQDADESLSSLSVTMPSGLLGSIKNIAQCPEPLASQGNCSPESLLGDSDVAIGAGPAPYWVHGGKVYLTGPYNHGPFGLTIVTPTTAGPFTLTGNGGPGREIVRASIRINSSTGQISVVSDPLPTILEGIPLKIRTVHITVNRRDFTFNATNCKPQSSAATITSSDGAAVTTSSPYQAQGCAGLPFHPSLTASTAGTASRGNGAALSVKVKAAVGQANIAKTYLTLPKLLPSRLDTIKKACPDSIFATNPASCDEGAVIGTAVVHTPLLKSALSGPAYLVSHGGAAFPDVEFVLQGEGVTLIIDGATDIKKGITYSRFESIPDAPIESFEAVLPTGPHSALGTYEHAANGTFKPGGSYSLCGTHLVMPTVITAQDGAEVKQNTNLTIAGCPKVLTLKQKLAKALKTCRKTRGKNKRNGCERIARRRYGSGRKTAPKP